MLLYEVSKIDIKQYLRWQDFLVKKCSILFHDSAPLVALATLGDVTRNRYCPMCVVTSKEPR